MEQFGSLTLGSRLKRLSDDLFNEVQSIYSQCDIPISATYFPILRLLQTLGDLSVVEIAESLQLSHPAVSKQASKMIKEGLLEKTLDETDQRRSLLRLSEQGWQAMLQAEPILAEMKVVLERLMSFSSDNFMAGLVELESRILGGSVADKVLDRLACVDIVEFETQHEGAFYDLNMAWLERYFPQQIVPKDYALLTNPYGEIINQGGTIWVAVRKTSKLDSVLGAIAFQPSSHPEEKGKSAEVFKLCVADHVQGKGIAQSLLSKAIEQAVQQGFSKVVLETASCLTPARRLYDKNGFVEKPSPRVSLFDRANVYMEKELTRE